MRIFAPFLLSIFLLTGWQGLLGKNLIAPDNKNNTIQIKSPPGKTPYVFLFVLDGCSAEMIYPLIESSYLKNIKFLGNEGTVVESATCMFPSLTFPNQLSILTGLSPGNGGVTGLEWYDPTRKKKRNYLSLEYSMINGDLLISDDIRHFMQKSLRKNSRLVPKTIFELLKNKVKTATYNTAIWRGADYSKFNGITLLLSKTSNQEKPDQVCLNQVIRNVDRDDIEKIPNLFIIWLQSIDLMAHSFGPYHEKTREAMQYIDQKIGDIMRIMKSKALLKDTYFIITADHGMSLMGKADKSISAHMTDLGFNKYYRARDRRIPDNRFNYLIPNRSVSSGGIFFPYPEITKNTVKYNWKRKPTLEQLLDYPIKHNSKKRINIVNSLFNRSQILLILAKSGSNSVDIFSKIGRSRIYRKFNTTTVEYAYRIIDGQDPLELVGIEKLKTWINEMSYHTGREWHLQTMHHTRPNCIALCYQIFNSNRAGDLIVTSQANAELKIRKAQIATHGSLIRQNIEIPLIFYGPDIKKGYLKVANLTDIMPTILKIFNFNRYVHPLDGIALNIFQSTPPNSQTTLKEP